LVDESDLAMLQTSPAPDPAIIVKVIETPTESLGDVVLGAIGLSGLLTLIALILGLLLGAGFIAFRVRQKQRRSPEDPSDHQQLHLRI
jgi:hypothetical protein